MRLPTIKWNTKGPAGDNFVWNSDVTLTGGGDEFRVTVPEDLIPVLKTIAGFAVHGITHTGNHYRLCGPNLNLLRDHIGEAIKVYLRAEVREELVIQYARIQSLHYAVDPADGTLHPNGRTPSGTYRWNDQINSSATMSHQSHPYDYTIGLKAQILAKRTTVRGEATKIEYLRVDCDDHDKLGVWGRKLNGFVKMELPHNKLEIPYTEDKAKALFKVMMALCHLSEQMDAIFGDPDAIPWGKLALVGEQGLLMPAPAKEG